MQNIFRIPESWHDPVSSLNRTIILVFAVLFVESFAFLLKEKLPPIYLLGLIRTIDVLILLIWGHWGFKETVISKAVKDSLAVTSIFIVAGLLFLTGWKLIFGSSMLKISGNLSNRYGPSLALFYVTSCLLSPIVEELIFRGILYRKMRDRYNMWISIAVVSSIFALIHYFFNGQALVPFIGSIIFCTGYEKTKFILTPIFLHVSGNFIIFLSPFIGFI